MYCRQNEIGPGDLSAANGGMIPDAIKQETGTGSTMLQPGKQFKLQKPKASEDQQTQRGKLASQVSAGAQPCQKREKPGPDTNLQRQVKSKSKKKNRLGQRARQQLGRAKQAENCPKKTFMVSQTFLWQQCLTENPSAGAVYLGQRALSVLYVDALMLVCYDRPHMVFVAAISLVMALLLCADSTVMAPLNNASAWLWQWLFGQTVASPTLH